MLQVAIFTFNGFQENTYVLYDETNECAIIDPGCSTPGEEKTLSDFIESNNLTPKSLINTHCHIDHVLGNQYVADKYGLKLQSHKDEQQVLGMCKMVSQLYGIAYNGSPPIEIFLNEQSALKVGNQSAQILYTPGHSPASISFYFKQARILISGDVLFQGSIGRTDLPGGDYETLIESIKSKLLVLDENTTVYPGHGPSTTIGIEKNSNPFLIG